MSTESRTLLDHRSRRVPHTILRGRSRSLRDAAIAGLAKKSTTFAEELARNTALAYTYHGDFEHREKAIEAVRSLTRERFIELARGFLGDGARVVSIQLDGSTERQRYQERSVEEIRSAGEGWHKR